MTDPRPIPRFTGIFFPAEILSHPHLTPFETLLLGWIDALYCEEHGGCFASNKYLASKLKDVKENTIAKAITQLRKYGLIEDVSFDGRKRVMRATIGRFVDMSHNPPPSDGSYQIEDIDNDDDNSQSNPPLDLNPSLGWIKIQPPHGLKSKSIYKDDINELYNEGKEENKKGAPKGAPSLPKKKFGDFVELTESEFQKLNEKLGKDVTASYIQKVDFHIGSKGAKYKSHFYTILNWHRRDQEKSNQNPNATIVDQKKSIIDENKSWAKFLFKIDFPEGKCIKIQDTSVVLQTGREYMPIGYAEPSFRNLIVNKLRTWGIPVEKALMTCERK